MPRKKRGNKSNTNLKKRVKEEKKVFLKVFRDNLSIISLACQKVNINRSTFYDWCDNDKVFFEEIQKIKKEQAPIVEDKLLKAIVNDNLKAIMFYLKNKHPDYTPKQLIDLVDKDRVFKMIITTKNDTDKMGTNTKAEPGV